VNEENNNNNNNNNNSLIYDAKNSKSIIVVKDSTLQLSESSPPLSSLSIDIVDTVNKKKDERLELLLISKGLIEIL
jgi:hypothetical protein